MKASYQEQDGATHLELIMVENGVLEKIETKNVAAILKFNIHVNHYLKILVAKAAFNIDMLFL